MTLTAPPGWKDPDSTPLDADLCGEPQGCDSPPCGEIPSIEVIPPGGPGSSPTLSCTFNGNDHTLDFTIEGGVLPFTVEADAGLITMTGPRSFNINLHPETGPIAYFRPWAFTGSGISYCVGAPCSGDNPLSAFVTADVRLHPFDCMGIHIPRVVNGFEDNLAPDQDEGTDLDHPIGDDPDERTCDIEVNWGGVRGPSSQPSDPDHWSPEVTDCIPAEGEAFVHVTAQVAGKNGVHGTIHAAAPNFDETVALPVVSTECGGPTDEIATEFTGYIDVRTQAMIDTGCCLAQAGETVTLIVQDARGVGVAFEIPVV